MLPARFPARNRIISGLAQVVVVVEGRLRSGALMTARLAAEQGREVFAAPGSLNQPTAAGPLALIADGARPLVDLDDLVDAANSAWSDRARARTAQTRPPADRKRRCTGRAAGTPSRPRRLPVTGRAGGLDPARRRAGRARMRWRAPAALPAHQVLSACAELATCGVARATGQRLRRRRARRLTLVRSGRWPRR